jgi:putative cell wall-binding protein
VRAAVGVALVAGILAALALGGGARSPVHRIQGPDRYVTAAQVALASFRHADSAVLARGDDLADATAASYLAGAQHGGPILLTPPDALPPEVLHALTKLGVTHVYIVGDATAISPDVDSAMQREGMRTVRIAGINRYATAAGIEQAGGGPAALPGLGPTALLVNADDTASAVVAGPVAYRGRFPLLFADAAQVPTDTLTALHEDAITHVILVGGIAQLGDSVVAQLAAAGISTQRLAGADPAATAVAVAQFERGTLHWQFPQVDLVRGDNGAVDGVAAIPNAGSNAGPLLLTRGPGALGDALEDFLVANAGRVQQLVVVGDSSTITAAAQTAAVRALKLSDSS